MVVIIIYLKIGCIASDGSRVEAGTFCLEFAGSEERESSWHDMIWHDVRKEKGQFPNNYLPMLSATMRGIESVNIPSM